MIVANPTATNGSRATTVAPPILRFVGGAGTVTGSKFLVEAGNSRVLLDAGLFQGTRDLRDRNRARFPVDPATLDAVVLSHAHLDHVGYLPLLIRRGFRGSIYASAHTASLATIVLADSGRLQEEEADYANRKGYSKHHPAEPLYTEEDALAAAARIVPIPMGEDIEIAAGMAVHLRRAGHILGSSTVTLRCERPQVIVVHSGDLGRPNHPLLLPPEDPPDADVMLIESTYGNRHHDDEQTSLTQLASVVNRTIDRGGVVVIPAFAVDRTEVVLMRLAQLRRSGRTPQVPVYVDSPMSLSVLEVYRAALTARDPELRVDELGADPFDLTGMVHEAHTVEESRALNNVQTGIIIASSGMATGGRVLHHLSKRLPDRANTVALVGYQSVGTRGQLLAGGAPALKMLGHYVPVHAEVAEIGGFSVHADADELVAWAARSPRVPDVTYVVHGEQDASRALARRLGGEARHMAVVPQLDERVRLD